MKTRRALSWWCAFLFLGKAFAQEVHNTPAALQTGRTSKGSDKLDTAAARIIDHTLSQTLSREAKSEILSRVIATLSGAGDETSAETNRLILQYSAQLLTTTNRPDKAVQALLCIAKVKQSEAARQTGAERASDLTAALRACVDASKIISANLKDPRHLPEPAVDAYEFQGDKNSPQALALRTTHEAQEQKLAAIQAHNNLFESELLLTGVTDRLKDQLNMSDKDFAALRTAVPERHFDPKLAAE